MDQEGIYVGMDVAKVSRAERFRTTWVSMVSENVRLSGQRKCHLYCSR